MEVVLQVAYAGDHQQEIASKAYNMKVRAGGEYCISQVDIVAKRRSKAALCASCLLSRPRHTGACEPTPAATRSLLVASGLST